MQTTDLLDIELHKWTVIASNTFEKFFKLLNKALEESKKKVLFVSTTVLIFNPQKAQGSRVSGYIIAKSEIEFSKLNVGQPQFQLGLQGLAIKLPKVPQYNKDLLKLKFDYRESSMFAKTKLKAFLKLVPIRTNTISVEFKIASLNLEPVRSVPFGYNLIIIYQNL